MGRCLRTIKKLLNFASSSKELKKYINAFLVFENLSQSKNA